MQNPKGPAGMLVIFGCAAEILSLKGQKSFDQALGRSPNSRNERHVRTCKCCRCCAQLLLCPRVLLLVTMPATRALPRLKARGRLLLSIIGFLAFLFVYLWTAPASLTPLVAPSRPLKPVCPESALANDVLVVLRTGATEAL
jgi:hypothetical protein